jgi:acyl-coenzyme A thioesterase PaaI-like protein
VATSDEHGYPPPDHVLRSLGLEIELVSDTCHDARVGRIDGFGALATSIDVLAGVVCGRAVAPDWMATSAMQLHLWQPPGRADHLRARLLRAGRNVVTIQVDIASRGRGELQAIGAAVLTFARLPRRSTNLLVASDEPGREERIRFDPPDQRPVARFEQLFGCVVLDAAGGVTSTQLTPQLRNSFGALNGGVVAAAIERSAGCAAGAGGTTSRTVALSVDYLGQATVGPVQSHAVVLDRDAQRSTLVRVELCDTGRIDADGSLRLMALGHVRVSPQ